MSAFHHPSDALLLDYATGNLGEGWSLAVATHVSMCSTCQESLAEMEAIGGAMLAADLKPAASCDEDLWSRVAACLDDDAPLAKPVAQPAAQSAGTQSVAKSSVLPAPLLDYLGGDIDALPWRRLGLGAQQVVIETREPGTTARLLRIPAGQRVPAHTHRGQELTLVLSGAYHDETGRFARGDFQELDSDVVHQPHAEQDIDCICLAITDAPLRFKSLAAQLAQPLIGI